MALSRPLLIAVALLLFAGCLPSSSATATHLSSRVDKAKSSQMQIWDLLEWKGLPRGLIPDAPGVYYTFNPDTGALEVGLGRTCVVQYDLLFQYEPIITGTLKYGSITELHGISIYVHRTRYDVQAIKAYFEAKDVFVILEHFTQHYTGSDFGKIPTCNGAISSLPNAFLQQLR